jgi:hypothetical protein
MKLLKQWSRKLDGWVERRRRFQKTGVERSLELAGQRVQKVPAVSEPTVPTGVPDSGKAR